MSSLVPTPLRFQPVFRRYIWGGRRLSTILGKTIDDGDDYAESWEVVDHGKDQSVVLAGPLAGKTLGELVAGHREWLLGPDSEATSFPLLLKYLDCNRDLSVQVHPDDRRAALLDPPDLGKTEAWCIVDAEPGAQVYAGLRNGVDRAALHHAITDGEVRGVLDCLHSFDPQIGDCLFIPAGVVHALGAGLLVAEIQQASDTTYRLFDWNRFDSSGQPRQLHVDKGLDATDFEFGPVSPSKPIATADPRVELLVDCDKFSLRRIELQGDELKVGGDGRFHLLTVLNGRVEIGGDLTGEPLGRGQTALMPAAGAFDLASRGRAVLLEAMPPN